MIVQVTGTLLAKELEAATQVTMRARDRMTRSVDTDGIRDLLAANLEPLLEANPELTRPLEHQMYVRDVVFSTGIADAGDHFIVASGEADLACRVTHVPKSAFLDRSG